MTAKAALRLITSKLDGDTDAAEALEILRRRIEPAKRTKVSDAAKVITKYLTRPPFFGVNGYMPTTQRSLYLLTFGEYGTDAYIAQERKLADMEANRSAQFDYKPPRKKMKDDELRVYLQAILGDTMKLAA